MNKTEFEKDLEIDIENLEVEACLQPELYFKYSSLAKDARRFYDIAKFKLSVKEAELARRARAKPAAFGLSKTTDPAILNKAQEAMEQRKRMLELLVTLHGREYFAGPNTPHSPDYFWKKIKEKKGEETNEKLIQRSRKRGKTRG